MLQDAHLTDIGAQGKQSTPSGAVDAEICLNALSTPRVSTQRLAGVSALYDSAHQGEWECHSGRLTSAMTTPSPATTAEALTSYIVIRARKNQHPHAITRTRATPRPISEA
jgi:hypothetical protein